MDWRTVNTENVAGPKPRLSPHVKATSLLVLLIERYNVGMLSSQAPQSWDPVLPLPRLFAATGPLHILFISAYKSLPLFLSLFLHIPAQVSSLTFQLIYIPIL